VHYTTRSANYNVTDHRSVTVYATTSKKLFDHFPMQQLYFPNLN